MLQTTSQVRLGNENDVNLFDKLCAEVLALGGSIQESDWVVVGSQEIRTYTIILPEGRLEANAETYVGLSLRGPSSLVSALVANMSGKYIEC